MEIDEVITAINSSPLFASSSTSSPSPQSSLGNPPSDDNKSPPPPSVARPCGACKSLRRRCVETCILAPYFPPTEPLKFSAVHRVFGASNVTKFLQELPESQRADAVECIVYEAKTRIEDPVYGCTGVICSLRKVVNHLQMELSATKAQLLNITCQQKNLPAATMTSVKMKEAQLPMLLQPSVEEFIFGGSTPTFQTHENYSCDSLFLPFDVKYSGGI